MVPAFGGSNPSTPAISLSSTAGEPIGRFVVGCASAFAPSALLSKVGCSVSYAFQHFSTVKTSEASDSILDVPLRLAQNLL